MTDLSSMPGGYTDGKTALSKLVEFSALLNTARDARARLQHALNEIDRMINEAKGRHGDALRAVERFADEQPASLGVSARPQLAADIASMEGKLTVLERDVADVMSRAGREL